MPLTAEILGLIGICCGLAAFAVKRDQHMLGIMVLSQAIWTGHFALLGAYAAAASTMAVGLRCAFGIVLRGRRRGVRMSAMVAFVALGLAMSIPQVRYPYEWLAVIAPAIATVAIFTAEGLRLRGGFFASSMLWIGHNLAAGSWPGVVAESIASTVNLIRSRRLLRERRVREISAPAPASATAG